MDPELARLALESVRLGFVTLLLVVLGLAFL
jgi:hypothetical protein